MWEFIDQIVFINLDYRTDRLNSMTNFFQEGKIPLEKVTRFSAIRCNPGAVGCSKSHVEVLKLIKEKGWKNTLVLEDDVEWIDFEAGYAKLKTLIQKPFDVLMLGGLYLIMQGDDRILKSCYTSSYIVSSHYVDTLLNNFQESLNILTRPASKLSLKILNNIHSYSKKNLNQYHIDVHWQRLQKNHNWLCIYPEMVGQTKSYSDIKN